MLDISADGCCMKLDLNVSLKKIYNLLRLEDERDIIESIYYLYNIIYNIINII